MFGKKKNGRGVWRIRSAESRNGGVNIPGASADARRLGEQAEAQTTSSRPIPVSVPALPGFAVPAVPSPPRVIHKDLTQPPRLDFGLYSIKDTNLVGMRVEDALTTYRHDLGLASYAQDYKVTDRIASDADPKMKLHYVRGDYVIGMGDSLSILPIGGSAQRPPPSSSRSFRAGSWRRAASYDLITVPKEQDGIY